MAVVFLGLAYWILARSSEYDHVAILVYALHVVVGLWLPGLWLMSVAKGTRLTVAESLALGLPAGFAFETALYLGVSAAGPRSAYVWILLPAVSGLGVWLALRKGWRHCLPLAPGRRPLIVAALAAAGLVIMVTAATRMHAPAPLSGGRLLASTHHDWVYLLAQAGEIKWRWPLEDPNLAGTPLSYHYFLLVHAAAASHVTGLELPIVLFRTSGVIVGMALLAQVYVLGRSVGRSPWAGVLAAWLLFATGEVSLRESTTGGWFGNLFIEWLYVSPTFALGMAYTGALLIWIHGMLSAARLLPTHQVALFLLAAAATGAKGTAVVPLGVAVGFLGVVQFVRARTWPGRYVSVGAVLFAGWLFSYGLVLRTWRGDGTAIEPLAWSRITAFWQQHAYAWRVRCEQFLPDAIASVVSEGALAAVVFLGGTGVLVLGLAGAWRRFWPQPELARWLVVAAVAHVVLGLTLFLESHGESYLYLPMRLPLAVLTAGWFVESCRRLRWDPRATQAARWVAVSGALLLLALMASGGLLGVVEAVACGLIVLYWGAPSRPAARGEEHRWNAWPTLGMAAIAAALAVQVNSFCLSARSGLRLWLAHGAVGRDVGLESLDRALQWIREHTPVDTVLIADLFTPQAAGSMQPGVLEKTTADKYYYYGAIAERRLWVQGPSYLRDQTEAKRRMAAIAELKEGRWPPALAAIDRPCYLLVDCLAPDPLRRLQDGLEPVFANERARVYRLTSPRSERFGEGALGDAEKKHSGEKHGAAGQPNVEQPRRI